MSQLCNITTIFGNFKSHQNLSLFVKKEAKWNYKKMKLKKPWHVTLKGFFSTSGPVLTLTQRCPRKCFAWLSAVPDSALLDSALSRTALISLILGWSGQCSALRSLSLILVSFILKHTSTAGKYAAFDLGIFAIPTHQSHTVTVYCIYKKYFLTLH